MDNCTCTSRERVYIVYGNDFTIEAHVSVYDKDEGIYKLLDLTGVKKCQMRLVGTYRKAIGKDVAVSGSKVTAFFPGGSVGVGTYGVEITFVDSLGKGRIFERNLIGIVSASGEATVDNDIEGEAGEGLNVSVNVLTRTVRIGDVGSVLADYNLLENRPSIGGVTLEGDRRPSDLGIYSKEEADEKFQTKESAAEADKRVQGMLDGKVDKIPGKGLSANDLTDERAGKVDKLKIDGRANEYLNGAGIYSRPVRQGYGVSVADDNTVSVDPQVIARQSDVTSVAADLAAQKAKEQGDIDRANAAISKEETDRKAAVAALQSLIDTLNPGYQFMGVATPETNPGTPDQKVFYIANGKSTYPTFGGIEVSEDEVVILYYDTAWHKLLTGIASQEKLTELELKTSGLDAITDNVEFNSIVKELLIPQSIYDAASWIRVYNGFSGLYGIRIYDSSNQSISGLYTNSNIPYISNPQGGSVVGDWSKLGDTQYKDFKNIAISDKVTLAEFNPIISSILNNASIGTLRDDVSKLEKLSLTTSDELNQIIRELYIPESRFSDYLGVNSIRVLKCLRISDTNYRNGIIFYKNRVLVGSFFNNHPSLSDAQEDLTKTPFVAGSLTAVVNWDKVENDDKTYAASFTKVPSLLDQKIIFENKSLIVPSYTITEHKFVFSNGSIQGNGTTTDGAYTSPMVCKKGDKLSIFTSASSAMSVVSVLKDGNYIPKVIGDGTKLYEYVCEEDSLIVISYNLSKGIDIKVFPAGIWETYVMQKLETIPAPYEPGSAYYFEGTKISPNAAREHFVYEGDTKKTSNYIVNAVVYPNGEVIAARQGGTIVKIALDGTETTLLTINGASDWRGLFMDSNLNVYASPHASVGSSGGFAMTDRGLYKLAYGSDSFVKVISLYNPSSTDTPETQPNDDTIWTMCEDADGYLYGGVYCHTQRFAPRIYRSADGGNTWEDYFDFLSILPRGHHVHCIIYNEYNNALYAIIGEVNTILKSTDHGQTWTNLNLECEGGKGTAMIAVPDGVIIGSDGAYELTMSKMNVDETKITTRGRVWANTCFGTRKSDVTGWIYAFGKIDSSVNSTSYMPPVSAISDAAALQSWKDSSPAHLAQWEKYHNYTKDIYPDDCIRPQHFAILVSKDNGNTWEVAYHEQVASTAANGIWCVGYFKNGECLCGRFIGGQVQKPLVISEGKHKYSENGINLDGEIFIRTNTGSYID